jgi:hypothetical protein
MKKASRAAGIFRFYPEEMESPRSRHCKCMTAPASPDCVAISSKYGLKMIFAQSGNNWFARLLRARHPRRVLHRSERAPPRLAIVGSERWLLDLAANRLSPVKDEQPNQDELLEISQVRARPAFAVGASSASSWPGSRFIVVRFLPSKVWLAVAVAILTTTPAAASTMLTAELAAPPATRVADHRVNAGRENSTVQRAALRRGHGNRAS